MKKILNILLMGTTLGCCVGAYKAFAIDFTKLTHGLGILGGDISGGSWNISKVGSGLSNLGYSIKRVKDGGSYLLEQVGLGGVTKTVGTNAANQSMKIGFSEAVRLTNGDVSQLGKLSEATTQATTQAAGKTVEQTGSIAGGYIVDTGGEVVDGVYQGSKGIFEAATDGGLSWSQAADGTIDIGNQTFKSLDEVAEKLGQEMADQMAKEGAKTADELAKAAQQGTQKAAEEAGKEGSQGLMDTIRDIMFEQTVSWNYGQYAIQIAQAVVANQTDEATKKVKVKGADPMGGSQGSPNSTSGTQQQPEVNTPISGSTVVESVNALVTLINMNPIDLSLLSTEVEENKTTTQNPLTMGSSGSQAGLDIIRQGVSSNVTNAYSLYEEREILNRRKLLLAEWAAAATQIGEGSNAISSDFYTRAKNFITAASASNGSIGGVSTINDTDRFVLFELTRGALLSAVQLGLQSAVTLNELKVTPPVTTPAQGAVSLPGNRTQ